MRQEEEQQPGRKNAQLQEEGAVPQVVEPGQGAKEGGQEELEQIQCHLNIIWEVGE